MTACNNTSSYRMLGIYRYVLAICVVMAHTGSLEHVHLGYYAVLAFFTLSGFLLTRSLRRYYLHTKRGYIAYLLNRSLRVYPLYMFVAFITCIALIQLPMPTHDVHHKLGVPEGIYDWLVTITIIGNTSILGERIDHFLIPASWSLSVELVFWTAMFILCRTQQTIYIWCLTSVIIYLALITMNAPLTLTYYSLLAGSCAFSIGAFAAMQYEKQATPLSQKAIACRIMFAILYYALTMMLFGGSAEREAFLLSVGLPIAIYLNYLMIFACYSIGSSKVSPFLLKVDRLLGDLSYPTFISHIIVLYLMLYYGVIVDTQVRTWHCFVVNVVLTTLFSLLLVYAVERPLEHIRSNIKYKKT